MRARRRRSGFTLMEVMLAVFIISIALLSLQAVVSGALLSSGNSVTRRAAREACAARLARIVAVDDPNAQPGDEEQNYGFKVSVQHQDQAVGAADQQSEKVVIVTVRVDYEVDGLADSTGGGGSKEESYSISTAIRAPEQKGP